jgi:hypothetical protein
MGYSQMWQHYQRTFAGMQIMIAVVTVGIYFFLGRQMAAAVMFFIVMQIGALLGAAWAARLRRLMERRHSGLLRSRN